MAGTRATMATGAKAGRRKGESAAGAAEPVAPRKGGVRHLAGLLPPLTKAALGRRGFAEGGIVADWPAIVGDELAATSLPERLAFPHGSRREGTLQVRVCGALALELQHLEPVVIERINGYFGYRAVARLKIRQGPVPRRERRGRAPVPVDPVLAAEVDSACGAVADDRLRAALAGFGRALRSRKS